MAFLQHTQEPVMATTKQRTAAQPEGRRSRKPGSSGDGQYYHIEVRPRGRFVTFRSHDVGGKGRGPTRMWRTAASSPMPPTSPSC
jgi:hypothetical protein